MIPKASVLSSTGRKSGVVELFNDIPVERQTRSRWGGYGVVEEKKLTGTRGPSASSIQQQYVRRVQREEFPMAAIHLSVYTHRPHLPPALPGESLKRIGIDVA